MTLNRFELAARKSQPSETRLRLVAKLAVQLLTCCSLLSVAAAQAGMYRVPSDAEIRGMLAERIDVQHKTDAIVVGLVTKHGKRIISYGRFDVQDPRVPDGETVFEIGSITKVFTSLLLADMALKGEVRLSDPVSKYLPASVTVPSRNGKQITLLDLATHHSGLPPMPSNFGPKDPSDPNSGYSVEQMYDFLSEYQLPRDPGSKYQYSNLGAGLLGQALVFRAGKDYDTLLRERITGPLQMDHTAVAFTPEMKAHLAPGHDQMMKHAPNREVPALVGAGGIRSTADDMMIFLAANMGLLKSPLQSAMKKMLKVQRFASPGVQIGIGWHILTGVEDIVEHNGGTSGYHAFCGFDPSRKVGVIVLSNSANDIDDIGHRILRYPTMEIQGPVERKAAPFALLELF